MSHGLLQRLAERALGVAQPLRAQRAQPVWAGASHEREAETPAAVAPVRDERSEPHRAAPILPAAEPALPTPNAARVEVPQPLVAARAEASPPALHQTARPRPAPQRDETTSVVPVIARPAQTARSPLIPARSAAVEPGAKQPPPPHTEVAAAAAWPDLLPLLPEQPTLPVAPPAGRDHPALRRERIASRTAPAAERPTEVHVSIGRVELTALAPPPGAARPARTREPSRSLADYLRPGGKGSA